MSPVLAGRFFTTEPPGKPTIWLLCYQTRESDNLDSKRTSYVVAGNAEIDTDSGCSRYTLVANGTQCPSGSSGTTVVYTCEFISAHGARGRKDIEVTFMSVGKDSFTSIFGLTQWTVVCQDPLSMGILQARILEWAAMSSFRGSSPPRDQTHISRTAGGFFTI